MIFLIHKNIGNKSHMIERVLILLKSLVGNYDLAVQRLGHIS